MSGAHSAVAASASRPPHQIQVRRRLCVQLRGLGQKHGRLGSTVRRGQAVALVPEEEQSEKKTL